MCRIFFVTLPPDKNISSMNRFISTITVNEIFHLKDFSIQIGEKSPHLIITGKNGSGKTILLNAIAEFLNNIKTDRSLQFMYLDRVIPLARINAAKKTMPSERYLAENDLRNLEDQYRKVYSKVSLAIPEIKEISDLYHEGKFVLAHYCAMRDPKMKEPKNPTKPNINQKPDINQSSTDQFLNFLSDLKIQEALARNENQSEDAERIRLWFSSFEELLGDLYEDKNLHLDFNYKDYSFRINTEGKSFKFTELSDGFAAAIDIIADLILKMQEGDAVTRFYVKPGIVLIDEIETHLHLSLQKNILRILTNVFPKVQFIVTTHSPFVLSSLDDATAFDLEHRDTVTDLTEYSYESLAEGYFGVKTESSYVAARLVELKELLHKKELSVGETKRKQELIAEFDKIPEMVSPLHVGEYRQLMIKNKTRQS